MAIEFDGKGNIVGTTSDGVIAVKLYSLEKTIEQKDKEIERLNNIINELERKMLNDKLYIEDISKKQTYPIEEFRIRNPYTTGSYDTCVNYLGKIKELKGSDK